MIKPHEFDGYPDALKAAAPFGPYRAALIHWHDGDTGVFLIDVGFSTYVVEDIRVAGCNAPELGTAAGAAALAAVTALVPVGGVVVLRTTPNQAQSFIRYVAAVTLPDGRDLAAVLIASGQAVPWP